MNKLTPLVIFICASCSQKDHDNESWKEFDSFHETMAKAFHPLKDSGNIGPAKTLINDLADRAAAMASSSLPKKMDTPDTKSMIETLKTDSQALADAIKNGAADDFIKDKLTGLHSQFHKIMEVWEDHDEEKEHHHDKGDEDEDDD